MGKQFEIVHKLERDNPDGFDELRIIGLTLDVIVVYSELTVCGEKYKSLRFEGAIAHQHTIESVEDENSYLGVIKADTVITVTSSSWLKSLMKSSGVARIPWRNRLVHYSIYFVGCGVLNIISESVSQVKNVDAQSMNDAISEVLKNIA